VNFDPYLDYLISEKRSSLHTVEAYRNDLLQFSVFCEEEYSISDAGSVNTPVVRSWVAGLVERGLSPASVQRKVSALHSFYRFQMRTGQLAHNPAKGVSKPKKARRLPVFVEESKISQLYQSADEQPRSYAEYRDKLIVTLLYETGIRRSELIHLKTSDVDESLLQLKVLGKRNKMRYVPVSKEILSSIRQLREHARKEFEVVTEDWVFLSNRGKKVTESVVYLAVKRYLSGITTLRKKSPHVLRHTFATHMLNHGADLNVIKEILGHSSLAATQIYTHNSIEKLRDIHSRMHPRS
jgi:integrase/recombinase XerC